MDILYIGIIISLIIGFIVYHKGINKLNKRKETDLQNEIKQRDQYIDDVRHQRVEVTNELIENLKLKVQQLVDEIYEKQRFNKELIRLRQEELDDLIAKERESKKLSLENEMSAYRQTQLTQINAEVSANKVMFDLEKEKLTQQLEQEKSRISNEISAIAQELEDFRIRRESINEAILREKELQEQQDFYKVVVSEKDQLDIQILQDIIPKLNNREAISKLVWELYIRRPVQELSKRITNGRKISGIYKITYIKTGEAYIGKTTDIQTRWNNHLKTVVGLEGAAHSTLHTHMEQHGLWNYTFEILEEVDKDKLGEREAYYIDFYNTKNYGLNQKRGG